jgi:hypothetical protein
MSYEISYRRRAFRMTAARAGHCKELLFLLEEGGSSNCWELGNRRRARDWHCATVGPAWQCLAHITRTAAACCGGMLVLHRRRPTTPEAYIRAWRRTVEKAESLENAPPAGFEVRLLTRITHAEAADGRKHTFERLLGQSLVEPARSAAAGDGTWEWRFDPVDPEQVGLWLETTGAERAHCGVQIRGPAY